LSSLVTLLVTFMNQETDGFARVKAAIQELRRLDGRSRWWRKEWRVFGAKRHQFKLAPVLTETDIKAFEAKHGIVLPADYREFVQRVGDGGAGPGYGLNSLEGSSYSGNLSKPFPLTRSSDLYSEQELIELGFEDELNGVLQLCHYGCGMYSYLVVNGSEYGTVWYDNGKFHSAKMRFMDWYLDWINKQLTFLEGQK
jgi:hypothetical protein